MAQWNELEHPLAGICEQWLKKIDLAIQAKQEAFGRYADEAMKFYDGDHTWMWDNDYAVGKGGFLQEGKGILPKFRMTVNRVAEMVALYGPSLYHRNPTITVDPMDPPQLPPEVFGINMQQVQATLQDAQVNPLADPNLVMQAQQQLQQFQMMQQQDMTQRVVRKAHADLMAHYLNWLQREEDKKVQARRAITEALIKGLSLLQVEMFQPEGSGMKYPVTKFLSVDDMQVDPDARYWEDVNWLAIRCEHPVYQVEDEYGAERGTYKGHLQSKNSQGVQNAKTKKENGKKRDTSFDLMVYWKIYSKCGIGNRLKGLKRDDLDEALDALGKHCFLAVAKGIPYPLNVPDELSRMPEIDPMQQIQAELAAQLNPEAPPPPDPMEVYQQGLMEALMWPIPFWLARHGWPIVRLYFYDKPREVWPVSIVKTAIGELRFINWCMSFLADKAAAASTTYIGIMKSAAESIRTQIKEGSGPFQIIEVAEVMGMSIDQIVKFLDAPEFGEELYNVIEKVSENFDKRTGLTELMYGIQGTQARSATEMQIKDQNVSVRPDDMASQVEDSLSEVATREMQAARWQCSGEDVKGPLGEQGAWVWENQILTEDVDHVTRCFDFRVEAGSARKPNKANKVNQLNELGRTILPTVQSFAQMGQVGPLNAYTTDMAHAMDLDASQYLVQPPPPPMPPEGSKPPTSQPS